MIDLIQFRSMTTRRVTRRTAAMDPVKDEPEGQTHLNDFFKETRTRSVKGAAKPIKEKTLARSTTHTRVFKDVVKVEAAPVEKETSPAPAVTEPVVPAPKAKRALKFAARESSPPEHPLLNDESTVVEKANALTELLKNNKSARSATRKKVRNVAELQAVLASTSAAKTLHSQNVANKGARVDEHAHLLKSPTKRVQTTIESPQKKTKTGADASLHKLKKASAEVRAVPSFVLPGQVTPSKKQAVREEQELDEAAPSPLTSKASLLKEELTKWSWVPLPDSYQQLVNKFQHLDRVVSIFNTQGKRTTWDEVQQNVQRNLKQNLTIEHLSQMLNEYEESYNLKVEEMWSAFGGFRAGKYEYVIEANMNDDLDGALKEVALETVLSPVKNVVPLSPRKAPPPSPRKVAEQQPDSLRGAGRPRLEGWRMACRSTVLRHRLAQRVLEQHRQFMEQLGSPLSAEEESSMKRLHPAFRVETCEAVPRKRLPELPKTTAAATAMRDYMKSVEDVHNLPQGVQSALEQLKSPVKEQPEGAVPLSPQKFAEKQAEEKKKGGMSLLDRIRAKEAAKREAESKRDPVKETRKARLSKLRMGMLRTVTSYYAFKKCRSATLAVVTDTVTLKNIGMSKGDIHTHLQLMCEVAPDHCQMTEVMNVKYLQVKQNDFAAIDKLMEQEIERCQ